MKEATGEGSMTVVTIVIIAALVAAAAIVVSLMMSKAKDSANKTTETTPKICANPDANGNCP